MDRAALDVAIELDIEHGGWCPLGRIAEDGAIPTHYHLQENPSPKYSDRTKRNVRDSDATLILFLSSMSGGTLATALYAKRIAKPYLGVSLENPGPIEMVLDWIAQNQIQTLNIAGPRASKEPLVYQAAYDYLAKLFDK